MEPKLTLRTMCALSDVYMPDRNRYNEFEHVDDAFASNLSGYPCTDIV